MKKMATLAAAAAVAISGVAPAFADQKKETVKTNDPFVSTQGTTPLVLGPVGIITVSTVIVAAIVGIADGSSTTVTTTN